MTEPIYVSNTAGTPTTVTASDVAIINVNIKPNQYNFCRISAFLEVSTSGTTVATQTVAVKIKLNGALIGTPSTATFNFKSDAVVRTLPFPIEYVGDISQGGALTITISSAAIDTGTTFTVKRLYVTSIA